MRGTKYLVLSCLFFLHCAQPSVPSGGERDNKAPLVKSSSILNGSTNQPSTLRKIVLEFDENIQMGNGQEIMFSPRLNPRPEIIAKAKKIVIKFTAPLEENTTYLINFGKSIKDYTEGNVLDSNVFAFSTGPEIDSLSISGVVVEGYSRKPVKDAVVMLFKESKDSALYSGEPQYYNFADDNGQFRLPFLKEGSYQIFGLADENNNLKYDLPEEKVYFSTSALKIEKDTSFDLSVSPLIEPRNYVTSHKWPSKYHLKVFFEKELNNPLSFTKLDTTVELQKRYSSKSDSVDVYFYRPIEEKEVIMKWGNNRDTITVESAPDTLDLASFDTLKLNPDFSDDKPISYFEPIKLSSNMMIKRIQPGRAYFTHDSDTFPLVIKPADSSGKNFFIDFDWKQSTDYTFYLPPGLLESYNGTQSLEKILNVTTDSEDNYSTLYLELMDWTGESCIIQLESGEEIIEKQYLNSGEKAMLVFEHLPTKKYDFRLIYDTNHNGQWDIGDYSKGQLPERVRLMTEGVETKKGFDFEVQWFLED